MPAPQKITILGTTYRSLRQAAAAFDLPESTLRFRIDNGIEPEVCVVATDTIQLAFVSLKDKAYYKVPWSEDPVNTREIIEHYRPDLLDTYDKSNPTGEYRPYTYYLLNGGNI